MMFSLDDLPLGSLYWYLINFLEMSVLSWWPSILKIFTVPANKTQNTVPAKNEMKSGTFFETLHSELWIMASQTNPSPEIRSRGGTWPRCFVYIISPFYCVSHADGLQKNARRFSFSAVQFTLVFFAMTKLHLEVHISRQVVSPHVTVHIGQQASVEFSLLFIHDIDDILARILARIYLYIAFLRMQPRMLFSVSSPCAELPLSMYNFQINCIASNMCANAIAEHRKCAVASNNCVVSNMCASKIA